MGWRILGYSFGFLLIFYTNCSGDLPVTSQNSVDLGDPSDVNNFKENPPAIICGQNGYMFLVRNYLRENCGSCHANGGIQLPYFADTDPTVAFWGSQLVTRESWLTTITQNRFCGPACNLRLDGPMYKGFLQWLDHRGGCP